jgi:hypothetical protein
VGGIGLHKKGDPTFPFFSLYSPFFFFLIEYFIWLFFGVAVVILAVAGEISRPICRSTLNCSAAHRDDTIGAWLDGHFLLWPIFFFSFFVCSRLFFFFFIPWREAQKGESI